ncbi:MAG: nitrogenase component 1 [Deltaproteobacteria bacterium]|nr:nitrogenase component 1 [Deltaproteobacteria bacterium]
MSEAPPRDDTLRTTPSFMDGVFMVAGAIPDALLLYRGSSCIEEAFRAQMIDHDLRQTLTRPDAPNRLWVTRDPYTQMVMGTESEVMSTADGAFARIAPSLVLLSELPRYLLAGEDLRAVARALQKRHGVPVLAARTRHLDRSYEDAWEVLLAELAGACAEAPAVEPDTLGLLGYLAHRSEGDVEGDLLELARLAGLLGLELLPPWLSGAPWPELQRVAACEQLIALPGARKAAQRLRRASETAALELPLPLSLEGSSAWLQALGEARGRGPHLAELIGREQERILERLETVADRLLGRRVMIAATREWLPGMVRCLTDDLGLEVDTAFCRSRGGPEGLPEQELVEARVERLLFDPSVERLQAAVEEAETRGPLDLLIGSAWEARAIAGRAPELPVLEFGYPQVDTHPLRPRPHLGFEGVLTLAERVLERLSASSAPRGRPRGGARRARS